MSTSLSLRYTPTPKQKLFHETTAREVLYGGAAGGGKSHAIVMDALLRCLTYRRTHAYMFRRTYPELEQTLIQKANEIIPPKLGIYRSSEHKTILKNGSEIHFCHLNDEDDLRKYQGAEIQWLYFDELTHFTQHMYEYIRTRLRAVKSMGIVPVVRSASNPGGPGHSWVKAYFVDSTQVGQKVVEHDIEYRDEQTGTVIRRRYTTQYIPATVRDNPYLTDDYTIELLRKPPKLREALLYGHWDAFEGQCFPEFVNDPAHYKDRQWTHVIDPLPGGIPLNWPRYVSFDHGYRRPYSFGVWAVDPDGRIWRYKELYGCKPGEANTGVEQTPAQIGMALADLMEPEFREGLHVSGVADPAIWDQSRGESVEEQIRKVFSGVIFRKGDNTRLPGKMQVHERLKFDENGIPMMYVYRDCKDFIRTLPTLSYDPHKVEDVDTDGEDHCFDEARYFCMSRPLALVRESHRPPERATYEINISRIAREAFK